jgi:tripartite-type tricarboxylate transporter receptor subunit TctC
MARIISMLVALAFLFLGNASELFGQSYPNHAISLILSMAPGDALDVAGRLMADELAKLLKVPVIPLNKPGASATVGTDAVVKAKNDGYTILLTNNASLIYAKVLQPEIVPYDPFKDLTPLGLSTISPAIVAVRNDAPYKNFKELVEYAKRNPGKIRCGTPGVGSGAHFNVEIIKTLTGAEITFVPYKGASPGVTALLGGHVETTSMAIGVLISHMRSGSIKGVLASNKVPEFPEIPTLKQLGYNQDLLGIWFAFFAPVGVQPQIRETLVSAIERAVKDPTISSKLAQMGMVQEFEPPEKLLASMHEEYKMVEEVARRSGMVK